MDEKLMIETLEVGRRISESGITVYAMSNGNNIQFVWTPDLKKTFEDLGYWVCSIFEHGHMVDL